MRVRLIADDDMIYTNGDIYGTDITLAEGLTAEGFYQITMEEYEQMLSEQMGSEEFE
jgi:hypothetical protein